MPIFAVISPLKNLQRSFPNMLFPVAESRCSYVVPSNFLYRVFSELNITSHALVHMAGPAVLWFQCYLNCVFRSLVCHDLVRNNLIPSCLYDVLIRGIKENKTYFYSILQVLFINSCLDGDAGLQQHAVLDNTLTLLPLVCSVNSYTCNTRRPQITPDLHFMRKFLPAWIFGFS